MFKSIISFFTAVWFIILNGLGIINYKAEVNDMFSKASETQKALVSDADFYVSVEGDDCNDGSFDKPFKTIEKAKSAVKALDKNGRDGITVAVKSGEYRVSSISFDASDSGTEQCPVTYCAYGDGEVVINGGVSISPADFKAVTDENILKRLSSDAKSRVVCFDLSKKGITADDYGKMYAIGSYNTAAKYEGDTTGPLYCELFVNDKRQTIARYPDEGTLKTGKVVVEGEGRENVKQEKYANWDSLVNPIPDTYKVSDDLANRINSWATLEDVWMMGCWVYDWADASTPIGEFNYEEKTLQNKYVSMYGAKEGADYYFYNVLEEITMPGEWYLDRTNGIIYLYPDDDFASSKIDLSLSTDTIITGSDVNYITFDGFTIKGTRSDAVSISGNNVTIKNCLIKNVAGNAVVLNGYNNLAQSNEITHTGRGGIYITGGDTDKLIPGNSRADNNFIHDWSDIYTTYQAAVSLKGVGNVCSHNEIYNSPHEAITYTGNNHIIEYNEIHDVCLKSNDAGAIYSGRSWFWYGDIIRYNCVYNLGSEGFSPNGIYLDDALSGQTVYGNLLINIPGNSLMLGGGRDLIVQNNVVINSGRYALSYDDRARAMLYNGWFNSHVKENGEMWVNLEKSPYKTEIWQNAFPEMKSFVTDFDKIDETGFVANPANSIVSKNVFVNLNGKIGYIDDSVTQFSKIENNLTVKITKADKIFTDYFKGDYSLCENSLVYKEIPDFEEIPVNKIGRY